MRKMDLCMGMIKKLDKVRSNLPPPGSSDVSLSMIEYVVYSPTKKWSEDKNKILSVTETDKHETKSVSKIDIRQEKLQTVDFLLFFLWWIRRIARNSQCSENKFWRKKQIWETHHQFVVDCSNCWDVLSKRLKVLHSISKWLPHSQKFYSLLHLLKWESLMRLPNAEDWHRPTQFQSKTTSLSTQRVVLFGFVRRAEMETDPNKNTEIMNIVFFTCHYLCNNFVSKVNHFLWKIQHERHTLSFIQV